MEAGADEASKLGGLDFASSSCFLHVACTPSTIKNFNHTPHNRSSFSKLQLQSHPAQSQRLLQASSSYSHQLMGRPSFTCHYIKDIKGLLHKFSHLKHLIRGSRHCSYCYSMKNGPPLSIVKTTKCAKPHRLQRTISCDVLSASRLYFFM
jgi:hypothetical protein